MKKGNVLFHLGSPVIYCSSKKDILHNVFSISFFKWGTLICLHTEWVQSPQKPGKVSSILGWFCIKIILKILNFIYFFLPSIHFFCNRYTKEPYDRAIVNST